jgi:hypothetical protein
MNWRLVAFAAVMSALLGGLFGFTLSYLDQSGGGRFHYESRFYRNLYRSFPLISAGLGGAFGAGFAVISQTSRLRTTSLHRREGRLSPPGRR